MYISFHEVILGRKVYEINILCVKLEIHAKLFLVFWSNFIEIFSF
jgi:hypothetical protein